MKPADAKSSTFIDFDVWNNDKGPKFKVGGRMRTQKYKKYFANGCTPNQSEELFAIKKANNTVQ